VEGEISRANADRESPRDVPEYPDEAVLVDALSDSVGGFAVLLDEVEDSEEGMVEYEEGWAAMVVLVVMVAKVRTATLGDASPKPSLSRIFDLGLDSPGARAVRPGIMRERERSRGPARSSSSGERSGSCRRTECRRGRSSRRQAIVWIVGDLAC
jgi:hypothetical protein